MLEHFTAAAAAAHSTQCITHKIKDITVSPIDPTYATVQNEPLRIIVGSCPVIETRVMC